MKMFRKFALSIQLTQLKHTGPPCTTWQVHKTWQSFDQARALVCHYDHLTISMPAKLKGWHVRPTCGVGRVVAQPSQNHGVLAVIGLCHLHLRPQGIQKLGHKLGTPQALIMQRLKPGTRGNREGA